VNVHRSLAKLTRKNTPATIYVVNSPSPDPPSVSTLDVLREHLPAMLGLGEDGKDDRATRANQILTALEVPVNAPGTVHSEAALMALIYRAHARNHSEAPSRSQYRRRSSRAGGRAAGKSCSVLADTGIWVDRHVWLSICGSAASEAPQTHKTDILSPCATHFELSTMQVEGSLQPDENTVYSQTAHIRAFKAIIISSWLGSRARDAILISGAALSGSTCPCLCNAETVSDVGRNPNSEDE